MTGTLLPVGDSDNKVYKIIITINIHILEQLNIRSTIKAMNSYIFLHKYSNLNFSINSKKSWLLLQMYISYYLFTSAQIYIIPSPTSYLTLSM